MSPEGSIRVSHLWKRFRADRRRMLFRDELQRFRDRLTGNAGRGWRWVLRDIDLGVEPGESIGLVGVNGSGKTTLLKILSRVMYPHSGRVDVIGRVGALIEVRAGIHADLSGRENIFLMGSLLGLRRKDVARRFDDIVTFAELEGAIDRQLKFYSSGMQTRLGFAVAAFLEPNILLVDEVLAVGDANFQQKCLDRMRAVITGGTTLVFVSHDLPAVESTCTRGVWLGEGRVLLEGPVQDVLKAYRQSIEEAAELMIRPQGLIQILEAEAATNGHGAQPGGPLEVRTVLQSPVHRSVSLFLGVSEGPATPIFIMRKDLALQEGATETRCTIAHLPLPKGRFYVWMAILDGARQLLPWHPAARFDVMGPELDVPPRGVVRLAPIHVAAEWDVT
jgi:ABC-type polysaccharide/polyol phosphate transport system ATPase subunit